MNDLRVAVIGAGFISANRHLPAWRRARKSARIVALSDLNHDAARQLAVRFDVPRVYREAGEMIAREKPDVVDICTPPATHASLACAAIKQGAHVVIEKPMATSIPECDAIIEIAERERRQVCVGHSGLFYRPFIRARELIDRGDIGAFRGMRVTISTPTEYMTSNKDHWAHRLPGGAIGETGPHAVYMSLPFIKEIDSVTISAMKLLPQFSWSRFEDYRIDLIGAAGISSISVNYATNQWMVAVEIAGSEGTLQLDLHGRSVVRIGRPRLRTIDIGLSVCSQAAQLIGGAARTGFGLLTEQSVTTHDRLISAFIQSLSAGQPSPVTAHEGREAVKVMDMIARELTRKQAGQPRPAEAAAPLYKAEGAHA